MSCGLMRWMRLKWREEVRFASFCLPSAWTLTLTAIPTTTTTTTGTGTSTRTGPERRVVVLPLAFVQPKGACFPTSDYVSRLVRPFLQVTCAISRHSQYTTTTRPAHDARRQRTARDTQEECAAQTFVLSHSFLLPTPTQILSTRSPSSIRSHGRGGRRRCCRHHPFTSSSTSALTPNLPRCVCAPRP